MNHDQHIARCIAGKRGESSMSNILPQPYAHGEEFKTCAQHLQATAKKRPKAMICVVELPGGDVSLAVSGDPDQLIKMMVAMAGNRDFAPYILTAADMIDEQFDDAGTAQ
jgi:hypothetical protein